MKKFMFKCLQLCLPIFLIVPILNFFYMRTNYWKSTETIAKFTHVPTHIQLANVGSSHGFRSFDYSDVLYQSFNFALDGQWLSYDYGILRQYVNHFEKNAVLFIPISYFHITLIPTDFSTQRERYYRFLDKKYMDDYSIMGKILSFPVWNAGTTLIYIIKDIHPQPFLLLHESVMTEPELTRVSIEIYQSWTSSSKTVTANREEAFAHNKNLVSHIIEFCYAHDIQPVLVTTPITSVLNNIYMEKTPAFFDNFYRFTRELQEAYPSLPYFDYSHDSRFENDFSLFEDPVHLNNNGAEKFTAIVISDLQASGLLR